jgi:hypothetical protein
MTGRPPTYKTDEERAQAKKETARRYRERKQQKIAADRQKIIDLQHEVDRLLWTQVQPLITETTIAADVLAGTGWARKQFIFASPPQDARNNTCLQ